MRVAPNQVSNHERRNTQPCFLQTTASSSSPSKTRRTDAGDTECRQHFVGNSWFLPIGVRGRCRACWPQGAPGAVNRFESSGTFGSSGSFTGILPASATAGGRLPAIACYISSSTTTWLSAAQVPSTSSGRYCGLTGIGRLAPTSRCIHAHPRCEFVQTRRLTHDRCRHDAQPMCVRRFCPRPLAGPLTAHQIAVCSWCICPLSARH